MIVSIEALKQRVHWHWANAHGQRVVDAIGEVLMEYPDTAQLHRDEEQRERALKELLKMANRDFHKKLTSVSDACFKDVEAVTRSVDNSAQMCKVFLRLPRKNVSVHFSLKPSTNQFDRHILTIMNSFKNQFRCRISALMSRTVKCMLQCHSMQRTGVVCSKMLGYTTSRVRKSMKMPLLSKKSFLLLSATQHASTVLFSMTMNSIGRKNWMRWDMHLLCSAIIYTHSVSRTNT